MSKIKIFNIADIHLGIGSLNPEYQWQNLEDHFFKHIDKEQPDIIVVSGDIMDEKVNVNSSSASVFHMFIDKLIDTGRTVLIIEGTKSHDDNQINVFSHRVNDKFRIYSKVTKDFIMGLRLLLIPEEYMHDPDEYYKEYLNDTYDYVFGHGMFDHVAYMGKRKSMFRKLTSPMWSFSKHFKPIVIGDVSFGHVHTHDDIYVSSFGRYNHGEEEDKGFVIFEYDIPKRISKKRFIVNNGAKIFKTIKESNLPLNRSALMEDLAKLAGDSYKLRIQLDRDIDGNRKSDIVTFSKKHLNTTIDNRFERKRIKLDNTTKTEDIQVENKYEDMDMIDATIEFAFENYKVKLERDSILKILNSEEK